MKRTRGTRDRLTGGTNDVNPQLIHTPALFVQPPVAPAVISNNELVLNMPINRFNNRTGHSIIIELLKIFWDINAPSGTVPLSSYTSQIARAFLSTKTLTGTTGINGVDPSIIASKGYNIRWSQGDTVEGSQSLFVDPFETDLTDGAGHGILVAVDKLYFTAETVNMGAGGGAAILFNARLMYRFKEVTLEEYIGIVQGQQTST